MVTGWLRCCQVHEQGVEGELSSPAGFYLGWGVPVVVAGETKDKSTNAARVAYHRLGVNLWTATPTPQAVAEAVSSLLEDRKVHENVLRLAKLQACRVWKRALLPGHCLAAAFSASNWASSRAEPMCSMFGDPRREDHMIWAAVVPDAVFWRL